MLHDGTLSVKSGGDSLKADNDADSALGYVSVRNGTITVTAGGDAIAAATTA